MSHIEIREKAILLRKKGMSYSQIKEKLGVSKSTLSGWLNNMPLSTERIKELRHGDVQIEKTRQTKLSKKLKRRDLVYRKVSNDIRASTNDMFVSGFYLYWGEGTKTAEYTVSLTNSDPSMVRYFIEWLELLGVVKSTMRVKLHIYSDQSDHNLKKFWSETLDIPLKNFNKSYIKQSLSKRKTHKGTFPHGTCVVAHHNRDIREYVMAGILYLRNKHGFAVKE